MLHHGKRAAAGNAGAADPYFENVSLLLTGNGTNGAQNNTFLDSSSNNFTITRNGNTTQGTFSPTAPYSAATIGGSGYFDGTGDYLQAPNNAAFNFGTGEFTVEAWVYLNTLNTDKSIIDFRSTTNSFGAFYISGSGNVLGFYDGSVTASGTALVAGAWYHVAYVRTGTTLYAYLNGVQQWTRALSTNITSTGAPKIGSDFGGGASLMNGYISNLRVVKGTAVYTANFTPPTAPLTAITNTSLLLNFTNAGIPDAAMMNDLETVGNAQVSTSVKKYGTGSLAFDGTGDWLTSPANGAFGLTGDFTIEFWYYLNVVNTVSMLVGSSGTNPSDYIGITSTRIVMGIGNASYPEWTATSTSGTWYHLAVVRQSGTIKVYQNGNALTLASGSASNSAVFLPITQGVIVGLYTGGNGGGYPLNGYIDDLRITKGLARYTANFTPPTAALPTY